MALIWIVLLASILGFADDKDKGRKGNKQYHEKNYELAAGLFREGLVETDDSSDPEVRTGLANNLGCALNRLESYDEAAAAFAQSIQLASNDMERSRGAYNAGNNAFQAQDPEKSLDYFRQALMADPTSENARFNYEFVRRMMEQQQESGGEGDPKENPQDQEQQDQEQEQGDQEQDEQEGDQEQEPQQEQNEEQQQEEGEDEQKQGEPEERKQEMSEEQAEQILQALQNDEEELMRQVWRMKGKPRNVEKDW